MCGIAGILSSRPAPVDAVERMVDRMRHRGPDDAGISAPLANVAVGSARLSIIDLSPAGRQPMTSENGGVWIVFNGEVYNFRALRAELERSGHRFRSRTDTEVVLHAYEEWGADCVRRLRGMFAFAVVDGRAAGSGGNGLKVLLARDPLGIKPLYYAAGGGALVFASEVRALLAAGLVPRRLSPEGLAAYLLWGSTAEPQTLVDGVRSLPPGHRLVARVAGGALTTRVDRYWRVVDGTRPSRDGTRATAVADLRALLQQTVGAHLVADVPVGVFLSGGVDSTAVAALAAASHGDVATVTVSFPDEPGFSEAALARATARRLGARHHEVALTGPEMLARLDDAVGALDQPSMDGINTYFVSWGARQAGLTVALSGLGGDELFGGYGTFAWVPRLEAAAVAARAPLLARPAARTLRLLAGGMRPDAVAKLADVLTRPNGLAHPYAVARALFPPGRLGALLNGASQVPQGPWVDRFVDEASRAATLGPFGRVCALELGNYLVNTLLRDTDCMSMAHSLEVRVPFVDREVVEFVTSLPEAWRVGRGPKALLLEAVGDLLPPEMVRGRKRTFTLPWERWLRGPLAARVARGIEDIPGPLREILDPVAVRAVWREFLAGRTGWARPWALCVLNEWVRRHLAG